MCLCRIFDSNTKLDMFLNLLSSSVLESKAKTRMSDRDFLTNSTKSCIQILHSFRRSSALYRSYFVKIILGLAVGSFSFTLLATKIIIDVRATTVECKIESYTYQCAGQPAQFYFFSALLSSVLVMAFIVCNVFNFAWLMLPKYCELNRVLDRLLDKLKKLQRMGMRNDLLGETTESMYYKNRDLRLLLNLLASGSGIAYAIHVLALFDSKLR